MSSKIRMRALMSLDEIKDRPGFADRKAQARGDEFLVSAAEVRGLERSGQAERVKASAKADDAKAK